MFQVRIHGRGSQGAASCAVLSAFVGLHVIHHRSSFYEVPGDLHEANAPVEVRRRITCGNCSECDNCYGMCPADAVVKAGRTHAANRL